MRNSEGKVLRATILAGAAVLVPCLTWAQDPGQQQQQQQQEQGNPATQPDAPPQQEPPPPAPLPPGPQPLDTQIHPAGQAVPWLGTSSPLRWGDLSIGSFTYNYVNDRFAPLGGGPDQTLDLNILRTSVVLQHYFGKQLLLLQYDPQVAILNGKFAGNAGMDNEVALGTTFNLSPRFTFVLKDGFAQVNSRELYPPNYLAVDGEGGNLIQNNFLQDAGSYLSNTVTGIAVYQLSQRDTLTSSTAYRYAHADGNNQVGQQIQYVQTGDDITEAVAYTHRLTLRQSVGATYTLEVLHQAQNVDIPGNTFFQTIAGFYALQLSQTWFLKGELGANIVDYPNNVPPQHMLAGTVAFVKNFKNDLGNFAIGYTRGVTNNNFLTAQTGDLLQATYSQHLLQRLIWNSGAGYYRQTGADPRSYGKMLSSALDYEFAPAFFISAQYSYLFQNADVADLLSGRRNTAVLGIRWEPHVLGVGR